MPTFICSFNWTDQGIRSVKDVPKRAAASKELAKKLGVEVKQVYLTSGEHDFVAIRPTGTMSPNGRWRWALRAICGRARSGRGRKPSS
jgi:uncharacterized protein with GYD domain